MRRLWAVLLVTAPVVVLSGCIADPAYDYKPIGTDGQKLSTWSETIDNVRFETGGYYTMTGRGWIRLKLDIANNSANDVVLVDGAVSSNSRTMEFASGNGNKKEAQTVLAQSAGAFEMSWNLDGKAVSDVLGPTILCKWRVRIGQEERTLEIKMQRKD